MARFKIGAFTIGTGSLMVAAGLAATPLAALTMQECSAAYKAAKSGGTLGAMTWQEFRKAKCGPATPAPGASPEAKPGAQGKSGFLPGAVFPRAIVPQYAKESPGKARMLTCLDQYRRNKAGNANGGLKWTQKGGGYYSECNSRLKQ